MKRISVVFVFIFFFASLSAQDASASDAEVFNAKTLHFYGFDFTGLKVADGSRIGQNSQPFIESTAKMLGKQFNEKEMEIRLRKGKGNIPFNTSPTVKLNALIDNKDFISEKNWKLSAELLSEMVRSYSLEETSGIGYTVIFECFDRQAENISEYLVFFDIATRKIISARYLVSHDKNRYDFMGSWKEASVKAVGRLLDRYTQDLGLYRKQLKEK